jgi:DNA-binding response OmpR family regulator
MRILIIVKDVREAEFLELSLRSKFYVVDVAYNFEYGSYLARTNEFDAVICEHHRKEFSAVKFIHAIRQSKIPTPIIIVSNRCGLKEKVDCFDAGCDDFIEKPYEGEEIALRLKVLLRRPRDTEPEVITAGQIVMETKECITRFKDEEVYLTKKEFALLEFLMKNKGKVISRTSITEHVWNMEINPFSNTIETHILNLRKKLRDPHKHFIRSIPGRGYKIMA